MGRFSTRQVTLSTSRSVVLNANARRTSWAVLNESTSINVLFAESSGADGFIVLPQTAYISSYDTGDDPTKPVYVWGASGTPNIRVLEWFN